MDTFPWATAAAGGALILLALWGAIWFARRPPRDEPLPTAWALTARPVFTADERRVQRLLREALPNHLVLAKLPLVRFCQPMDPQDVGYWFQLLGGTYVTFAVCSANGRVLAGIDLDRDRSTSRRSLQIKQSVLGACRIRYLRCTAETLPSPAELQLLVPIGTGRQGSSASGLDEARDSLSSTVASRRAQRNAQWQDSTFNDSFFAFDSRLDSLGQSDYGALAAGQSSRLDAIAADDPRPRATPRARDQDNEIAGVVVDSPPRASRN